MQYVITAREIDYTFDHGHWLFRNLSFSLGTEKTGLVGKNGSGKTILLKIITNQLQPTAGSIDIHGTIAFIPQDFSFALEQTIAQALGVSEKLDALQRLELGAGTENDFELMQNHWDIQEHIEKALASVQLIESLNLNKTVGTLSGGQITRLFIARLLLQNPDYLILDEPTNNLDEESRTALYQFIASCKKGMLIVSHDRTLLNLMDQIAELSSCSITWYGGNYDFYHNQKRIQKETTEKQLNDAQKLIKKTKAQIQESNLKHQKREQKGLKERAKKSQSKTVLGSRKERSEQTKGTLATNSFNQLKMAQEKLQEAREQIEIHDTLHIDLPSTSVPAGKVMVSIDNLVFSYPEIIKPILNNITISVVGPERIAFIGPNGSGKTTLLKLISGTLQPTSGSVRHGTKHIFYLDQHVQLLDSEKSVLENFNDYAPHMSQGECRNKLGQFLFKEDNAMKLVRYLSGGEKMRAGLACILAAEHPPQLLLLDEPTNHMDLESIEVIEKALRNYKGTLIVISHDKVFLEHIGIDREINLPYIISYSNSDNNQ